MNEQYFSKQSECKRVNEIKERNDRVGGQVLIKLR